MPAMLLTQTAALSLPAFIQPGEQPLTEQKDLP